MQSAQILLHFPHASLEWMERRGIETRIKSSGSGFPVKTPLKILKTSLIFSNDQKFFDL
jgi:hypothetical protein